MNRNSDFHPNWASTPGDTIADILKDRQLTMGMFAKKMNSTVDHVRELIHGYIVINDDIANKLEKTLGTPAEFWIRREAKYRESMSRLRNSEEEKWLKELPIHDMVKLGWLKRSENSVKECLGYFNVPDVWTWRNKYSEVISLTAFRKSPSHKSNPASISAWLRQGEIQAESIKCALWDSEKFKGILQQVRPLTRKKSPNEFISELRAICASCGVAIVIAKTPSGCTASGATKFVSAGKAMILLSFRYLSDDHFWFTFFHEAGHLLLHNKENIFIEDADNDGKIGKEEKEANEFSSEMLIPKELQSRLKTMAIGKREIMNLAKDAGVSLGIVVGQLQNLGRIQHKNLNSYKRRYSWGDISNL